ncbi:hypothetical protein BDZ97DRAFT_1797265 [Flammula alnicola]|nr:hypothetical protein BDZ97DRAFT_1797265 [Flammula alnicola]
MIGSCSSANCECISLKNRSASAAVNRRGKSRVVILSKRGAKMGICCAKCCRTMNPRTRKFSTFASPSFEEVLLV